MGPDASLACNHPPSHILKGSLGQRFDGFSSVCYACQTIRKGNSKQAEQASRRLTRAMQSPRAVQSVPTYLHDLGVLNIQLSPVLILQRLKKEKRMRL